MKPILLALAFVVTLPAAAQTGHVLNGVGPIDQSMSGAGMARPQDALTALHWNPAALLTLDGTRLDVSLQLMTPTTTLTSSINPNALGPNTPPVLLSGSTDSDAGVFPIPAVGFLYRPAEARWAAGVSAFGVGGFGVDYAAANPTQPGANPITFPQSAGGFGAINSSFALFQVSPTFAYALTPNVGIGVAPTLNVGMLEVNPFPAASPDQAGYPQGPRATSTGFGFQAALSAHDISGWDAALSVKSTQVFGDYTFKTGSREFRFAMDYPMILSAGIAFSGIRGLLLAADLRYIDFENTDGFGAAGFDRTGAVTGFGWKSIVVAAFGLQYRLTDRLPLRLGYAYNENPVEDQVAFFNVASPAVVQHHVSGGFSYHAGDRFVVSAAVQYAPKNDVGSTMQNPMLVPVTGGPVPNTFVRSELSTLTGILGVSFRF